jgi:hypothetical protein
MGRLAHGEDCIADPAYVAPRAARTAHDEATWLAAFEPPTDTWLDASSLRGRLVRPGLAWEMNGVAAGIGALVFFTGYGSALGWLADGISASDLAYEGRDCRRERAPQHVIPLVGPLLAIGVTELCTFPDERGNPTTLATRPYGADEALLYSWWIGELITQSVGLVMVLAALIGGHDALREDRFGSASLRVGPGSISVRF